MNLWFRAKQRTARDCVRQKRSLVRISPSRGDDLEPVIGRADYGGGQRVVTEPWRCHIEHGRGQFQCPTHRAAGVQRPTRAPRSARQPIQGLPAHKSGRDCRRVTMPIHHMVGQHMPDDDQQFARHCHNGFLRTNALIPGVRTNSPPAKPWWYALLIVMRYNNTSLSAMTETFSVHGILRPRIIVLVVARDQSTLRLASSRSCFRSPELPLANPRWGMLSVGKYPERSIMRTRTEDCRFFCHVLACCSPLRCAIVERSLTIILHRWLIP